MRAVFVLPLFLLSGILVWPGDPVEKKIFSLNIARPADAVATDIEFSDIDLAKATPEEYANARTRVVRTKEASYREFLPPGSLFFRVRSIHKTGVPGAFGKTLLVQDYLRKPYREPRLPLVQQGKTEYLLGSSISLPQQPGLSTKYRLDAAEPQTYEKPLVFDKPGTYKVEVTLVNEQNETVLTKNFVFKVELNAPQTRVVIDEPIHTQRGIALGKDSALLFFADDEESGVAQTFFRIVPLGKNADDIPFEEYRKRVPAAKILAIGAATIVQFYSVDFAGNKEPIRTEILYAE